MLFVASRLRCLRLTTIAEQLSKWEPITRHASTSDIAEQRGKMLLCRANASDFNKQWVVIGLERKVLALAIGYACTVLQIDQGQAALHPKELGIVVGDRVAAR